MPQAGKVVVMPLCGTTWADYIPTVQLLNRKKKGARSLMTEEYLHRLDSIFKLLPKAAERSSSLILVHDHAPAHKAPEVEKLVASRNLVLNMLPPWSPEVM
jgi:hypothetical protein